MIRPIMPKDVFALADLAEQMHSESNYKNIKMNKSKLMNKLLAAMANMILVGFVDEIENRIVGAIIGLLDTFFFGDDYLISGKGFYVVRDYRKTKTGINLLKEYIAVGRKLGIKQISMDTVGAEHFVNLDMLYAKAGFKKVGSVQIMEF